MGKFCGKCGNMLTEKGLCPACGWSLNIEATDTPETPQKVKKPKKKLIAIIAIILAVVILGGGAFGALTLKGMFAHKNYQPSYVYEMKDGSTIISILKEDKNGELSFLKPESDEYDSAVGFPSYKSVSDGKYIYSDGSASTPDYYSKNNLLRYEIKDNKAIATPILTEEQIRDYFDLPEDNRDTGDLLNTFFSEFVIDGDYIYFELSYYLGIDIHSTISVYRVKLSGGDLEPVLDEDEYSSIYGYTVYKDYIYYIGYIDEDDSSRRLCKKNVKTGDTEVLRRTTDNNMQKLSYHDGYIYFYEYSGDEQLLSRIKTNGKGYEVITDNHPFSYTFSDDGKDIYYLSFDMSSNIIDVEKPKEEVTGTTINKVSLSGKNDTEIFELKSLKFSLIFGYAIDYSDGRLFVGHSNYIWSTFYYDLSSEKAYLLETDEDNAYWVDDTENLIK